MTLASCDNLVDNLGRLQLLDEQQQRELANTLCKRFDDPRELMRELMRRDWLTAYQANQLLQQRSQELLFGPYLLLQRLGEGGMGQVFKARHRVLGRQVALKVIRKQALGNPVAAPRFEREVEAAARLQHPNVVRAFDAGKADGTYYLAMEFIEGVDLFQLLQQSGPLPVPQACDYVRQVALGLQHAHEHDLVHRDIKPANLFLARPTAKSRGASSTLMPRPGSKAMLARPTIEEYPWGVVKILDFGLARLQAPSDGRAALTQLGTVMGTPDFLAPEQANNSHTIDIRADLYSLGCTFYFLLSGRVPFPGGTLPEKLVKHRFEEPEPLDQVRRKSIEDRGSKIEDRRSQEQPTRSSILHPPFSSSFSLPAAVVTVAQKLMAKQPDQRFQTPAEVAEAMAELLRLHAKETASASLPPKTSAHLRRPDKENVRMGSASTIILPLPSAALPALGGNTTLSLHGRTQPRRRLRGVLVCLGFFLCCGLSGRLMSHDVPAAAPVIQPRMNADERGSRIENRRWRIVAKAGSLCNDPRSLNPSSPPPGTPKF